MIGRIRRIETKVCGLLGHAKRWRHIGRKRIRVMKKLDKSKVEWIVREKAKGEMTNAQIAETMKISVIWVKKLWARYRNCKPLEIRYPMPMGRPKAGMHGRKEHSAVLQAYGQGVGGAVSIRDKAAEGTGTNISHRTVHHILREAGTASREPKKSKRRKYVRYERTYSNSLWHTDYKMLQDGRWFISYEDDASRLITGFGVFKEATGDHAIEVLERAIDAYGKPAAILSDHGSQFFANAGEIKRKGVSDFEKKLVGLGIRHILAGRNQVCRVV